VAIIASRHHSIVRTFRAAARGDDDRALIDGWHLLHEASASGMAIDMVALSADALGPPERRLVQRLERDVEIVRVTASVMDALSPVRSASGVVALIAKKEWPFPALLAPAPALVVLTTDVQDPGNAGAIIRSAEAAGATGVILAGASADPWSWKALRAAMGSTFRIPSVRDDETVHVCDRLAGAGVRLVAATPRDGVTLYDADLRRPTAILIGGEGPGVPSELLARADERLTIPMAAAVESLNAAVAAALVVYEAARQRRYQPSARQDHR
jgi:RNA methyltransferase, TrmH family